MKLILLLILDIIEKIQKNEISGIDSVGNAFNLIINKNNVSIHNEYTEKSIENIDIDIFINCLTLWKKAVLTKKQL